jgi:leader peptidase (prepilin peptidase) / N-methyltransferase
MSGWGACRRSVLTAFDEMNPALFLFPTGLAFGSFATVVAHRMPRHENWVSGRSHCPSCGHEIAAYDNVPVLSWLALRGRCRNCSAKISARYPLTELAMAVLFTITAAVLGTGDVTELVLGLVLCALLVVVTLTDLEQRIIPNRVVAAGAVAGLAIAIAGDPGSLPERLLAAGAGGGILFLIALAYPRGLGMGDAKLVGMMGIYLGSALAPAVLAGLIAGSVVGVTMIARGGPEARKRQIPFGPFLALGGIVGLLAGDSIVHWYTTTFFGS